MKDIVTPKCCKEAIEKGTVYLRYDDSAIYDLNKDGQEEFKPKWVSSGWDPKYQAMSIPCEVKFCPHCRAAMPAIKKTDKKVCVVKDSGYYCDTCKERLQACKCLPPECAWEPNDKVRIHFGDLVMSSESKMVNRLFHVVGLSHVDDEFLSLKGRWEGLWKLKDIHTEEELDCCGCFITVLAAVSQPMEK